MKSAQNENGTVCRFAKQEKVKININMFGTNDRLKQLLTSQHSNIMNIDGQDRLDNNKNEGKIHLW